MSIFDFVFDVRFEGKGNWTEPLDSDKSTVHWDAEFAVRHAPTVGSFAAQQRLKDRQCSRPLCDQLDCSSGSFTWLKKTLKDCVVCAH